MPTKHLDHFIINLNGHDLDLEHASNMLSVEVDDSQYLPDMFAIQVHDPDLKDLEADFYKLGGKIKVTVQLREPNTGPQPDPEVLIIGEITSIEPDLTSDGRPTITIRGYDRSHKMNRERKTKTYLQVKDTDLAAQLAQGGGLKASVDETQVVYDYLMQANQTDWEFLMERALRIGYQMYVDDDTLCFKQSPPSPPLGASLVWGDTLSRFRPRMSTVEQVSEVQVYGWDPKKKDKIVGQATSPTYTLQNRPYNGKTGGSLAGLAHSKPGKVEVMDQPVVSQTEADRLAKAVLDSRAGNFVQAEAETGGNPTIRAGTAVEIGGVGERFGGQYLVTRSIHSYSQKGYSTRFWCSGGPDNMSISRLLQVGKGSPMGGSGNAGKPTALGVMVGLVTNNNDPDDLGRVKVKFPMLNDTESWWCRLATPMAGSDRGICFFPEVGDEVVVAFLNGDPNYGYVLGAVWNGSDKHPKPLGKLVTGSQTLRRVIRTRKGHEIMFDDTDEDTRGITIVDKTEQNFIKIITTPDPKIIIECNKDVEVTSKTGNITVNAETGKLTVKSMSNLDLQSQSGNISIQAQAGKISIQGTAGVDVQSSGITNVKGAMVNIN